jgi:hypothetical protein
MSYIIPETPTAKGKRVLSRANLDRVADKVNALRKARAEVKEVAAYIERLELEIKTLLGDAEEGTINGAPVLTYARNEKYAWAQFVTDNPTLAAQFSVTKEVQALDQEGLLAAHGELLKAYQTRSFRVL